MSASQSAKKQHFCILGSILYYILLYHFVQS